MVERGGGEKYRQATGRRLGLLGDKWGGAREGKSLLLRNRDF